MFAKEYGDEFTFADHEVKVTFESLPGEAEEWVEDLVRKDNFSQARIIVVGAALKKLVVDGKVIYKNTHRGSQRMKRDEERQRLPSPRQFFDSDAQESLTKRLTRMVVRHEFWLAEMFPECFEEFADEDSEGNPTPVRPETPTGMGA